VLIDVLIRRLGEGLVAPATAVEDAERQATDDEYEAPVVEAKQPLPEEFAQLCRRKTKQLVKRVMAQLSRTNEPDAARVVMVQLAAVASVLRALTLIAMRPEWVFARPGLVDRTSLRDLLNAPELVSAFRSAFDAEEGTFEELELAVGLMIWIGSEVRADAIADGEPTHAQESEWLAIEQRVLFLAPWLTAEALVLASEAILGARRRGLEDWLTKLQQRVESVCEFNSSGSTAGSASGCVPGDLVVLARPRRVRIALAVDDGVVTVKEEEGTPSRWSTSRVERLGEQR
jgi:hypothetical protein